MIRCDGEFCQHYVLMACLSHTILVIRNKLSSLYVFPQYEYTEFSKHTDIHTTVDGKATTCSLVGRYQSCGGRC